MNDTTYLLLGLALAGAPAAWGLIALIARLSVGWHAGRTARDIKTGAVRLPADPVDKELTR